MEITGFHFLSPPYSKQMAKLFNNLLSYVSCFYFLTLLFFSLPHAYSLLFFLIGVLIPF